MERQAQRNPRPKQASTTAVYTVPSELQGRVHVDEDELSIRDHAYTSQLPAVVATSMGLQVSIFAVLSLLASAAAAGMLETPLVYLVGLLLTATATGIGLALIGLGASLASRRRPLVLDGKGVHHRGQRITTPTAVRLSGELGAPLRLSLEGLTPITLAFTKPSRDGDGWTLSALVWFAELAAARLKVPVYNDVDVEAWSRWSTDDGFMHQVDFERRCKANRRRFPDWHRVPAAEPPDVEHRLDGLRALGVDLTSDTLCIGRHSIPIEHVRDAAVEITERQEYDGNGSVVSYNEVALLVLLSGGIWRVCATRLKSPGQLAHRRWLADQIAALSSRQPQDRGDEADIPDQLLALRDA